MTTQLIENQSQKETSIGAVMTVTAADRVLQHRQMLDIAEPKAGQTEFGGVAARANHGGTTIRGSGREIQRRPTEGLLPRPGFRYTVSKSTLNED
jgi:hypothetical protein